MALVNLTLPGNAPVTLDEAKDQCRIVSSDSSHDSKLLDYIERSTASIETLTGARLRSQSVRLDIDGFPSGKIDLGVYPVNSITSVVYDDADNAETAMVLGTDYWESLSGMYPFICPVDLWPATKSGKPGTVRITMAVGYYEGSPVTAVAPQDIKHAILIRVKEYFAINGESVQGQTIDSAMTTVKALTDMHRRYPV